MMPMLRPTFSAGALAVLTALLLSCNRQPTQQGILSGSQPPETAFAPTPLDGSQNNPFKLRLEWHGNDADGIIQGYEYRVQGPLFDNTWQYTKSFFVNFKFREGWYTVEVRAVDNTGTVDPTPARRRFHVSGPTFDRGILLLDDDPNGQFEQASDAFYDSLMIAAGYRNYTFWDYQARFATQKPRFTTTPNDTDATGAPVIGLGAFSTIIWCTNATGNLGLNDRLVQDYLDMGGNLWVAGSDPLQSLSGRSPTGLDLALNSTGYKYFHVLRAKAADLNLDWLLSSDSSFPDLTTSYQVPRTTVFQYLSTRVNQLIPQPDARAVYVFSNNYYRDLRRSLDINSEEFAGTPCAIIYSGSGYKTVLFGFPLVAVSRVGSVTVNLINTRAMAKTVEQILANVFGEPR
ncbi:MAG: hypothetical protein ONB48_05140 [candidate division KSB1 bacterium]|nr:hypothetical protein [candidate division KSB1 bacterium]MDZ7276546.1 hypothetical protein [candidate division KSB1 bacterium]MDZ7285036.1 hypothetical protein [candidate division KSB1 bacterium]MDZ7298068.1 hypothetical protein [candidate division KSB1 bacterium]MDZ7349299.1 hypothetical protein [candidate division KSB1 bacterium]